MITVKRRIIEKTHDGILYLDFDKSIKLVEWEDIVCYWGPWCVEFEIRENEDGNEI